MSQLLYIYLIMVIIFFAYTELQLWRARRSTDPKTKMILRETDSLAEEANLNDHGLSILMGLAWPWALYLLMKGDLR